MTASTIRLSHVRAIAVPVSQKTTWIVLDVELDDGVCGSGEATAFGQTDAVLAEVERLSLAVESEQPPVFGRALSLLDSRQGSEARHIVVNALEMALLDVVSRRTGMPLSTFLGGPFHSHLPVYANINRGIEDRSPNGFAMQAKKAVAKDSYKAIKIAPFDGCDWRLKNGLNAQRLIDIGVTRVQAVREAVGAAIDIHVDCHARFSPMDAARVIRQLAECSVCWIEEPVDASAIDASIQREIRAVGNRNGMRVAGGEHLRSLADARSFLAIGGHDVILPDLRLTGVRTGLAMLQFAVDCGVAASLHNPVGPVLDAVSRQVAAALPSFLILERQVDETPLFNALRNGADVIKDGCVEVGISDGHGIDLRRDQLERASSRKIDNVVSFAGMAGAGPDA